MVCVAISTWKFWLYIILTFLCFDGVGVPKSNTLKNLVSRHWKFCTGPTPAMIFWGGGGDHNISDDIYTSMVNWCYACVSTCDFPFARYRSSGLLYNQILDADIFPQGVVAFLLHHHHHQPVVAMWLVDSPKIFRKAFRFSDKQPYRGATRPPMTPIDIGSDSVNRSVKTSLDIAQRSWTMINSPESCWKH